MRQSTTQSDAPTRARARAKVKKRRSNAERTATARRKLIEAALHALYEEGYSATTTDVVARRAKVSRGAMLHHFRTRVDLMAAVAEYVVTEQRSERNAKLEAVEAGPQRFFQAADISWEVQKQPTTIALLEIMLATRSDRALKKRCAPLVQKLGEMRIDAATRMMGHLDIDKKDVMIDLLRVHLATLRGLAIELMFTQRPAEIERARQLFTHYEHTFARSLIKAQHEPQSEPLNGETKKNA